MSAIPYMKLYINDYLGDTQHLTAEQHGAYLLLLMAMWRAGGCLPNNPSKLCRIARISPKRWKSVSGDVMEFFVVHGDEITQERLYQEYQNATSISEKRRSSGREGGISKSLKNNKLGLANATILPEHSHSHSHNNPPIVPQTVEPVTTIADPPERTEPAGLAERELIDLKAGIVAVFREAGSMTLAPDTHRAATWLAQGHKPAIILATIKEVLARKPNIKTLSYFDNPIREAHEMVAKTPAGASQPIDEGRRLSAIRGMVEQWIKSPGSWPTRFGPEPDQEGTPVPGNILAEFGIALARRRAA